MSTQVRPGYKLTEIGVIPEDWDVSTIGQVVNDFRGGASLKPSEFSSTGVRVLPKGGIGYGGLLQVAEDEWQFCSQLYANKHINNQVDSSYTVIVLRDLVPSGPSIGLAVRISDSNSYVLAQGVYGFKVSPQKLEQGYIVQLSNTSLYRKLMNSIMVGSTQVHITNTAYKLAPIPLPPLPEQRAIAVALSDMDALIRGLDQLIVKKRDIKQAAMQQLLTGKQRLPGFSEAWEVKRLGDVLRVRHGKNQSAIEVSGGKFPILATGGEIGRTNTFLYDKPSVLIGRKGTIDRPIYRDEPFWTVDTLFYTEITKEAVPVFIYYKFLMIDWRSYNEASGVPSLNASTIEAVDIVIPDIAEQTAIAAILTDMDSEINALETRRDKARQLKHGMMQELLTGRIRLL